MDHVEVLRHMLLEVMDNIEHCRNEATRVQLLREKMAVESAITALSAKPEGEAVAWFLKDANGKPAFAPYFKESDADAMIAWYAETVMPEDREQFTKHPLYLHPPRSHGVVVDEAMVDRALKGLLQSRGTFGGEQPIDKDDMRAALVAVLGEDK